MLFMSIEGKGFFMNTAKFAIVLAIASFLQACATPSTVQQTSTKAQITKGGWGVRGAGFGKKDFIYENIDWSSPYLRQEFYWARLKKSATGYDISEVAFAPITRNDISEEILAVDMYSKKVFPAYVKLKNGNEILRADIGGNIVSTPFCNLKDTQQILPYSVCNSAFGIKSSSLFGWPYQYTYSANLLVSLLNDEDLTGLLAAAAEKRRVAKIEAERAAKEEQTLRTKNRLQALANEAEALRVAEAGSIKALSKLPRGYKDVCVFMIPTSTVYVLGAATSGTRKSEEMNCINFGVVASLGSLREAGFNVTNVFQSDPSEPRSSRYNLEKIR